MSSYIYFVKFNLFPQDYIFLIFWEIERSSPKLKKLLYFS